MENEITLKITCSLSDFYEFLEENNFTKIEDFSLDDYFFIPTNLNIDILTSREILSKALLIRIVSSETKLAKFLTFKIKNFDEKGNILNQKSLNCAIENVDDAKNILVAIGYRQIMNIKEKDKVYKKDGFQFALKEIENSNNLIEVETSYNDEFNTLEELVKKVKDYKFPVDLNNLFIKKAEIELDKILKR